MHIPAVHHTHRLPRSCIRSSPTPLARLTLCRPTASVCHSTALRAYPSGGCPPPNAGRITVLHRSTQGRSLVTPPASLRRPLAPLPQVRPQVGAGGLQLGVLLAVAEPNLRVGWVSRGSRGSKGSQEERVVTTTVKDGGAPAEGCSMDFSWVSMIQTFAEVQHWPQAATPPTRCRGGLSPT